MNAPVPQTQLTGATQVEALDSVTWQQLIELQVVIRTAHLERRIRELEAAAVECPTCGASPCPTPGFCHACREADQRRVQDRPQIVRSLPTPQVVVEAVWHCVRERGLNALQEPANRARLKGCDEGARAEINRRIAKYGVGK